MQVNLDNNRPEYDRELSLLTDYIMDTAIHSDLAFDTAHYCLLDSLGCAILALNYPECTKLLGPWIEGQITPLGARVPGLGFELDPVKAAFDIGVMIRWLDYNDTWLAQEWGHPSDNLGGIIAAMDYCNRQHSSNFKVRELLEAMIRAHEIQGVLALENSFNQVGLDHVILVKVATVGIVTKILGGSKQEVLKALSQAWVDGQSLRTYRHAPNTGSRKSWAAGDATSRGVRLAMLTLQGEEGYPSVLSVPKWGFYDVLFRSRELKIAQAMHSYVMENILFKISYPAEFHGQTAVECALKLHPKVKNNLEKITSIKLVTQESAFRIINKIGPLYNPSDRDHCLQYMVAIALIDGKLTADSYSNETAQNPLIDKLREKMIVEESKAFSKDYLDPSKRSIANRLEIQYADELLVEEIHYPVGHRSRREEGIPLLLQKFKENLNTFYPSKKAQLLYDQCTDKSIVSLPVDKFIELWLP